MNVRKTKAAIRRGVKKLNQTVPNWRLLVNDSTLDIGDCYNCLTGQVFGSYENALEVMRIDDSDADYYGFALNIDPGEARYKPEYERLTELWKQEIWGQNDSP